MIFGDRYDEWAGYGGFGRRAGDVVVPKKIRLKWGYGYYEEWKLECEVEYWFWQLMTPQPKWDNSVCPARLEYPLGWGEKAREVNRGVIREMLKRK